MKIDLGTNKIDKYFYILHAFNTKDFALLEEKIPDILRIDAEEILERNMEEENVKINTEESKLFMENLPINEKLFIDELYKKTIYIEKNLNKIKVFLAYYIYGNPKKSTERYVKVMAFYK